MSSNRLSEAPAAAASSAEAIARSWARSGPSALCVTLLGCLLRLGNLLVDAAYGRRSTASRSGVSSSGFGSPTTSSS
jgi:hypothetical protein